MTTQSKRPEAGFAHLAIVFLVVVLILGAGIAVFAKVKPDDESQKIEMSESSTSSSGGSSLQINQRNAARKNDASKFLGAVTEYVNNNNGQLPASYSNNMVSGSAFDANNVAVQFEVLEPVATFAKAQQPAVTDTSVMQLVLQAACGEKGETKSGPTRGYAVQFALEKVGGGYTSDCKEG